jgi:hypothetical protein
MSGIVELSKVASANVKRIEVLGTYKSAEGENLVYGFDQAKHQPMLDELIAHLGKDFPIAVLGAAVKHYRNEVIACKKAILDELFQADIDSFSSGGLTYEVKTEYNISFPVGPDGEPNKQDYFNWLVEKGYGSSIKSTIDLPKLEEAEKAREVLRDAGLNINVTRNIHGSTLKVLVRELEQLGEVAPSEVITVSPIDVLTIKAKK